MTDAANDGDIDEDDGSLAVIMSDSGPTMTRSIIQLKFHAGLRDVWFQGECHGQSNLGAAVQLWARPAARHHTRQRGRLRGCQPPTSHGRRVT